MPMLKPLIFELMKFPLILAESALDHFTPISFKAVEEISNTIASIIICRAGKSTCFCKAEITELNCEGSFSSWKITSSLTGSVSVCGNCSSAFGTVFTLAEPANATTTGRLERSMGASTFPMVKPCKASS